MNKDNIISAEVISQYADIMNEKNLEEITIEASNDFKLTLKAKRPYVPVVPAAAAMVPMGAGAPAVQPAVPKTADVPKQETAGNVVKAPIVGTFYAASAPEKPPFVKVGQQVKKGDVIMIIESMKLMNEVQSEFDGTVAEILVRDGEAVEYDQPIMIIK